MIWRWPARRRSTKNVKQLDVEQLKEKLKQLLEQKIMVEKIKTKYTVADLYAEAAKLVRSEMSGLKQQQLNQEEEGKVQALSKLISNMVLKEMKIA